MSTRHFDCFGRQVLLVLITGICLSRPALAHQLTATISVVPDTGYVNVEVSGAPGPKWSFRDSYAGVLGLANRVEDFRALDETGAEISIRRLAPGQFVSTKAAWRISYRVKLSPPFSSDAARVSWLTGERGLLLAADLLPVLTGNTDGPASLRVDPPRGWSATSNEAEGNQVTIPVSEIDRIVIATGRSLRMSRARVAGMLLEFVTDGEWAFADGDVTEMTSKILKEYREKFGLMPAKKGTLVVFPFPGPGGASQWTAETRCATVTILLGKQPSRVGGLAQLSTPLTHELFHLWVPNALALEGDYGWFYEGFTVYEAARTAVDLGLLTFPEFLNAIARAFDGIAAQSNSVSLIAASSRRWTTGQSAVYSKSMVIAFLFDLRMRQRGRKSLDEAYRRLFDKRGPADGSDGNNAAASALGLDAAATEFVRQFIQTPVSIDLSAELAPFGFNVETFGLRTRISVSDKLNKGQRDLLRQLGYNDVVRSPRR